MLGATAPQGKMVKYISTIIIGLVLVEPLQSQEAVRWDSISFARVSKEPVLVFAPGVGYPAFTAKNRVWLILDLDTTGTVQHARVLRSTDHKLDSLALKLGMLYRFSPAESNGRPIPVPVTIPIDFTPPVTEPRIRKED